MRLDTFYTYEYKPNFFVHLCYDREIHKEIVKVQKYGVNGFIKSVKSTHAAKCLITKLTKH